MPNEVARVEKIGTTLRKFVRRGARSHISNLLDKTRPEDVALVMRGLTPEHQLVVFRILITEYIESAGAVITEVEPQVRVAIIESLTAEELGKLLRPMSVDDAVFVVESLPPGLQARIVDLVDRQELTNVQSALGHPEDSAGRIMDSEFFALPESTSVGGAIQEIRDRGDIEMIFYVYIVDGRRHLVGVVSLRQLLLSRPERPLSEIMARSLLKVHTWTDQEEVAQIAARYDLLAIPVVDDDNRLVGVVTVDDIIDVVREEATEDFYKMVGTSDHEILYQDRSFKVAGIRLPWILVNLIGLGFTGFLLEHFQVSLEQALFLLTFVPVIMGMGGNIGSQTSTIAVRGLASGRIVPGEGRTRRFMIQQVKVGAILGVACAGIVGLGALVIEQNGYYALVVGAALFSAILIASLNGAAIPVLFQRLGVDPAIAAGPLVTTSSDIIGICIYFSLAGLLIDLLV